MIDPDAFVLRRDEVMPLIAREVVVAFVSVVFPLNVLEPENVFESARRVVDAPVPETLVMVSLGGYSRLYPKPPSTTLIFVTPPVTAETAET